MLIEARIKVNTRIIIIVVGVALIVSGGYFIVSQPEPEEFALAPPLLTIEEAVVELVVDPVVTQSDIMTSIAAPVDQKIKAPIYLEESDIKVMLAVADLSADLAQWLTPQEQIRKWVLFVDNAANGDLIAKHRPWQYSIKPLAVTNIGNKEYLAPSNYKRAKLLIDIALAMPPAKLAGYYYSWLPLLEKAYRELGKKGSFDTRFKHAIDNVLAAKNLPVEPELNRSSVMYRYQDNSLEAASDIDKLMWRLGFENTNNIQKFLRDLKSRM
jgi:hypothetical protein